MVSLQIISKVINNNDFSIIEKNNLEQDEFVGYEEEFAFIKQHYNDYKNVPDKATFLSQFPSFELVDVQESDKYLVDTLREETLYHKSVPVIQKFAELLKTNANMAVEYVLGATKQLQPNFNLAGVDITKNIDRYEEFLDRREHQEGWYFTTGFEELDDIIHGIQRGEELVVLFARINQGKSWISEKIASHIWKLGFNVGYISPEMSATAIGYRFDTLTEHFSNSDLMFGDKDFNAEEYKTHLQQLKDSKARFVVSTPLDFNRSITVSKVKNWIIQNKLDFVAVDGIKYMTDERHQKGDNKTTTLSNISEDLMSLSMELQIPILVVVQANRSGVNKDSENNPDLDAISDSDGIGQNASKVIAIRQLKQMESGSTLKMTIKKNRFGRVNDDLYYRWDIDTGRFTHTQVSKDDDEIREQPKERKVINDATDVF